MKTERKLPAPKVDHLIYQAEHMPEISDDLTKSLISAYPLREVQISFPSTMPEDDKLDEAITVAEAEYASDDQLIDAREALPQLKSKYFGKNLNAMRTLQEEMSGEFEKAGINSEEDI